MDGAEVQLIFALLTDPVFLAVAGVLLLILVVVVTIVTRRVVRRVRRLASDNQHLVNRARGELHRRTLPAGPARRAAALRQQLGTAVTETDRVVAAADHALVSATLAEQHRELGRLAGGLDGHLLALQRDPDAARVEAALPEAQRWTEQLCEIAGVIREEVRTSRTALTGQDVRALGEATTDGVAALRAGIDFLQTQVTNRPRQG